MDMDEVFIKLDKLSERRIQEAIEAGEFDNLSGAGKPLQFEDNPFVPEDMRVAFKVLQNSNFAPDWMVLAQEIDADKERLRQSADVHFASLRRQLEQVAGNPFATTRLRTEVERLKKDHKRATARHASLVEEINRKISTFNQTVPIASLLRVPLSLPLEMQKFEDRVPAYLDYVGE
ncbi:MAG TPA: DUF1992 domain-containing protein [Chloroflexia bacterium]|nr:DUF1992 domain-containing protein [Chloroflexia bacterium]